jgi:glycine hydroxymethyltransferase
MILCREEFAKEIDKSVFPGIQGGPLMHVIAAKAVCFEEALKPEFKLYAAQVKANAAALANALTQEGFRIVSGGTDCHLMLVDLRPFSVTGKVAQNVLDSVNITTNKNAIPFDPEKPFVASGIRLGSPAVTSRGMKEPEMAAVANLIAHALKHSDNPTELEKVRDAVVALCDRFPLLSN